MKFVELQKKAEKDLRKLLADERGRLHQLRFELPSGKIKNVRGIRETRRTIARILTLLEKK